MELIIKINMDGAAFGEEDAGAEVRQILKGEAAHFASFLKSEFKTLSHIEVYRLRDSNSNICGSVKVVDNA
ncbi:MAG: hypothetical protein WC373_13660 [Smithella sp.]|jgi:hypothetical protein